MTVNIPPGYAQAAINFDGPTPSGKAVVLMGYSLGEEGTMAGLASILAAGMEDSIIPILSFNWTITSISVTTDTGYYEEPVQLTGLSNVSTPPPNVTLLVRKTTGLRGRANRGRNYWPGLLTETDVFNTGAIDPTKVESIQTILEGIGEILYTAGYFGCILHSNPALDPTPITSIVVESKVATQRRRLR